MPQAYRGLQDLSTASLTHLSATWFGLAYLWNGLHAILLPALLLGLVPSALKGTFLGALTFGGLLLAMLLQPVAGLLSDRSGWLGHLGKRRPWMVASALGQVVLLLLMAQAGSYWKLAGLYVLLQLASAFVEAALQSLLPDLVPPHQRGRAAGFKNAAQIAGFVAGVGLGGALASRAQIPWALVGCALAVAITTGWTCLGTREQAFRPGPRQFRSAIRASPALLRETFRWDRQAVPGYARLLAGRGLLMAGFIALQSFAQYWIADVLQAVNPAATTATLMATLGAAIFLLAIPTGALADRAGRRPLNVFAGLLGALATAALVLVHSVGQLILAGGLVGAAIGIFLSANWAWAADLVPPAEAGRYLGLSNLSTAGAGAFARLLSGLLIDSGNALQGGLGYDALFLLLALGMLVGTWLLAGVPETRPSRAPSLRELASRLVWPNDRR